MRGKQMPREKMLRQMLSERTLSKGMLSKDAQSGRVACPRPRLNGIQSKRGKLRIQHETIDQVESQKEISVPSSG